MFVKYNFVIPERHVFSVAFFKVSTHHFLFDFHKEIEKIEIYIIYYITLKDIHIFISVSSGVIIAANLTKVNPIKYEKSIFHEAYIQNIEAVTFRMLIL